MLSTLISINLTLSLLIVIFVMVVLLQATPSSHFTLSCYSVPKFVFYTPSFKNEIAQLLSTEVPTNEYCTNVHVHVFTQLNKIDCTVCLHVYIYYT